MPNLITEEGGGLETDKSDYVIYDHGPYILNLAPYAR